MHAGARSGLCLVAVAAVVCAASPAGADRNKTPGSKTPQGPGEKANNGTDLTRSGELIGLLDVSTVGVTDKARREFTEALEDVLRESGGFRVVSNESLHNHLAESDYMEGCTFGPCLREVYRRAKVRLVVVARIRAAGSAYSILVSILDTRTGRVTSQFAETCPVCTVDEAMFQTSNTVVAAISGSGGASVPDPVAGPTGSVDPRKTLEVTQATRIARAKASTRNASLYLMGAGAIVGGAGLLLWATSKDDAGIGVTAAGGAFVTSGVTLWLISRTF